MSLFILAGEQIDYINTTEKWTVYKCITMSKNGFMFDGQVFMFGEVKPYGMQLLHLSLVQES